MTDPSSLPRRGFIKLAVVGSAGAVAAACSPHGRELVPLLIPEERLPSGVAYWSRGLCTECGAGCGVLVKRMEAIVPLTIDGRPFRQSRLVAKKLEGNPDHPLNAGGLCARGQAALEGTYHPLRLSTPLRRAGSRGSGVFQPASWEEALAALRQKVETAGAGGVAWLGRPLRGTEAEVVGDWLQERDARWWEYQALPAPRAAADAARLARLPEADFLLSFGNFLESWPAQATTTRAYSRFRRGGHHAFFQVEPRLSLTAANADRWIAIRPGTAGTFALGVAVQLLSLRGEQLGSAGLATPTEWLQAFAPPTVARICDVPATAVIETARTLAAARRPLVVGGPTAYAYPHAEFEANAIQLLAGLADTLGGVAGPTTVPAETRRAGAGPAPLPPASGSRRVGTPFSAPLPPAPRLLIVHEANPVFSAPPGWQLGAWLQSIPEIVVLGTLPDETVLQADLVLPLSTTLESWADDERLSADGELIATLNPPAMRPLHDTRALTEIIAALASVSAPATAASGGGGSPPENPAEAAIRSHWQRLQTQYAPGQPFPDFWEAAIRRGGFWSTGAGRRVTAGPGAGLRAAMNALAATPAPTPATPQTDYPYHLRLYESPIWGDGRGSWLSWLQELPDPTTSAMWCNWVEIHPQLATRLGLKQGDGVWVESSAGRIELPVFLYPGLHPETVAIPAGQGHYAGAALTNRGANAYALLAAEQDPETGALAWEATRVRLTPSGHRPALPLFGRSLQQAVTHR